ncbi:MAG: helix-turn-helix transcriptional regulator [Proteobacteria bacterium]|nr:helix-turn-helix transcriptional regulator [Pseudomonadota bacterium]
MQASPARAIDTVAAGGRNNYRSCSGASARVGLRFPHGCYGQFCPQAKAAEVLCQRWTLLVVRELIAGSRRFNELQRGLPQISPTLLTARLRQLESIDVVERKREEGTSLYVLTKAGEELRGVIETMGVWGHRWVRSQLEKGDLDAGLLMWDMRRSVEPCHFTAVNVVVQFEFPDAGPGERYWWLVSNEHETDLCLEDPGHEVDLLVRAPLQVMTSVWICETTFSDAVRKGLIEVFGPARLREQLPHWLQSSALARLGQQVS